MRAGPLGAVLAVVALTIASGAAAQPPAMPPPADNALHTVVFETDTLRTGAMPADLVQKFAPIHTLQAAEDLLKQNRIAFSWQHSDVDSAKIPIDLAMQLNNLPPNEVFMLKQGDGWMFGVVTAKH